MQKISSLIKDQNLSGSLIRAGIYTCGHIFIAATCNIMITSTTIDLAAIDAVVEPLINGVWYFALDRLWQNKKRNK